MPFCLRNGVYMNSKDLQNAALFMGYRRVENRYLKPVGNSCFGINPENGKKLPVTLRQTERYMYGVQKYLKETLYKNMSPQ